jgi:hypothetical protein
MSMSQVKSRQKPRNFRTGPVTRLLWWVAVLGAPALLALMLARYPSLPATVAIHYGRGDQPDGWGPKWVLLLIAALLLALVEGMAWLAKRPQWFNYPVRFAAAREQAVYREGERMAVWVNLGVLGLFAGVAVQTLGGPGVGLATFSLFAMLGAAVAGMIRAALAAR